MNSLSVALVYASFAAIICTAMVVTDSAWPLLGLIFTPTVTNWRDR